MMSFDWNDYISVSTQLCQNKGEASLRSSISRSYYALYNQAYDKLINEGERFSQQSLHVQTGDKFLNSNDRLRQSIGDIGKKLKRNRQYADYDKSHPTPLLAQQVLFNAQKAISFLQQI